MIELTTSRNKARPNPIPREADVHISVPIDPDESTLPTAAPRGAGNLLAGTSGPHL